MKITVRREPVRIPYPVHCPTYRQPLRKREGARRFCSRILGHLTRCRLLAVEQKRIKQINDTELEAILKRANDVREHLYVQMLLGEGYAIPFQHT